MGKRFQAVATAIIVLGAGMGGVWLWQEQRPRAAPATPELHTFLHINCKHHNHGPAWHKNHARTLGVTPQADD